MSYLGAHEIYQYALGAGFTPEQAVTMTAIALAESSGNTEAHAATGENSRGLWQVNLDAHPRYQGVDLFDPATNASAAYDVYTDAGSVRPWSVTHEDRGQPYLDYVDEARTAAAMSGTPMERSPLDVFMSAATAQAGDEYVFGAYADPSDADPEQFDCAELVRWSAAQTGVEITDGSWLQYLQLKEAGAAISVEEAARTPGALVFRFSSEPVPGGGRPDDAHVAISMGDGRTIEAKGRAYGVVHDDIEGRGFEYAAVIPGISETGGTWSPGLSIPTGTTLGAPGAAGEAPAVDAPTGVDTDGDGLSDQLETAQGLDPTKVDTDGDGASDAYEVTQLKTDATLADTDRDGLVDTVEASFGTDALNPDSDRDGLADGHVMGAPDADDDRLSDQLETAIGTDVGTADSDLDGVADGVEVHGGFDPTDQMSSPFASALSAPATSESTAGDLGDGDA